MVVEKRARSFEQKTERRKQIMDAATALIRKKPFHELGMADIAKKAGMAKGTVFLYFKTKEELFIAVTFQQFEAWFDSMDRQLENIARSKVRLSNISFLKRIRPVVDEHTLLPRMVAIMHVVLEQNIGYEEARALKRMLADRMRHTGMLIERCLPYFRPGQGAKLITLMSVLVIGLTHMAEPAPVIREIYKKEEDLRSFQIDFGRELFDALESILDGWQVRARRGKKS